MLLRVGSRGPGVSTLQQQLNTRLQPGPNLRVDGAFGPNTERAVRSFQRNSMIGVDGIVGPQTQNALSRTPAQPSAPTPVPGTGGSGSSLLRSGSRGAAVTQLQRDLNAKLNPSPNLATDGVFGPQTHLAVVRFQQQAGLSQDGIVGPRTQQALSQASSNPAAPPAPVPTPTPTPTPNPGSTSTAELNQIAQQYNVEPAVILAIKEVESGGNGFLGDGRPKILFEGHIFWRQLRDRNIDPNQHLNGNTDILYPSWDRTKYVGGAGEYARLERAKAIHVEAALSSASWGDFQIMGFNYAVAGYASVQAFVNAMHSASTQLAAVMGFCDGNNLLRHVRGSNKDWASFASGYNGSGYRANQYDTKLAAAYRRHVQAGANNTP